jgi:hypothetical protein
LLWGQFGPTVKKALRIGLSAEDLCNQTRFRWSSFSLLKFALVTTFTFHAGELSYRLRAVRGPEKFRRVAVVALGTIWTDMPELWREGKEVDPLWQELLDRLPCLNLHCGILFFRFLGAAAFDSFPRWRAQLPLESGERPRKIQEGGSSCFTKPAFAGPLSPS